MSRRGLSRICVALAVAACLGAGGCYERVVRKSGPATRPGPVYEPNLKTGDERGALDVLGDAIFGPVETERER